MVWLFNKLSAVAMLSGLLCAAASESYKDFPKVSGKVGSHKISELYLAANDEDRRLGLMNVSKISSETGVLFVFEKPEVLSFWMKNTFVPLSIGFFDSKGCLIEVKDMKPVTSVLQTQIPQYQSSRPAQFALEVKKGWFKKHQIKGGVALQIDASPALSTSLSPTSLKALKPILNPVECPTGKSFSGN